MPKSIPTMAVVAGLIAVLMGIIPTAQSQVGNAGNSTAAFDTVTRLSTTLTELLPLGVIILAAAAILYGTGILKVS